MGDAIHIIYHGIAIQQELSFAWGVVIRQGIAIHVIHHGIVIHQELPFIKEFSFFIE